MRRPDMLPPQNLAWKQFLLAGLTMALSLLLVILLDKPFWAAVLVAALIAVYSFSKPEWILPVLFFVLPFSVNIPVSKAVNFELPFEAILLWGGFLLVYSWLRNPLRLPGGPLPLLLLSIFAWSGISSLFSIHPLPSIKFLLAKSAYLLVFVGAPVLIRYSTLQLRRMIWLITLSAAAIAIYVLVRHSFLSFQFAEVNNALSPFFENHVLYAAQLICILPWLIWLYRSSDRYRPLIIFLAVVLGTAILLSFSRGAWLALPAALFGWQLLQRRLLFKAYLVAIILCMTAVAWLGSDNHYLRFAPDFDQTVFHPDFAEHMEATYQGKDMSTAERFHRWIAAARMGADHWITGTGPASFAEAYQPYTVPAFRTWVSSNEERSTVHNYWLLVWSEQGLPGLLLFLILIGLLLFKLERIYNRTITREYKELLLTIAAVLSILLTLNFLSDLMEAPTVSPFFYFCVGLILWMDCRSERL